MASHKTKRGGNGAQDRLCCIAMCLRRTRSGAKFCDKHKGR